MQTAEISYRVADFLRRHPPFHAMEEADLVELAARGRVRFHESHDFILWQGEPHRAHVFVVQQGTVSVWDEVDGRAELRDMLGAGDMLGVDRFNGAPHCPHSARADSDVVLYTFPAEDFGWLLDKYPSAAEYIGAQGGVGAGHRAGGPRREPHEHFLHDLVGREIPAVCNPQNSIREAARGLVESAADAIVVVDGDRGIASVLTSLDVLGWVAGGIDVNRSISTLALPAPVTAAPGVTVSGGALALAVSANGTLVLTGDGTPTGRIEAVVTGRSLEPIFGDQPGSIMRRIDIARSVDELRAANLRARAFALQHLTSAASPEWIARLIHETDVRILKRILTLLPQEPEHCWCLYGPAGRGELLTLALPPPVLILAEGADRQAADNIYSKVTGDLAACGYIAPGELAADAAFAVAGLGEWKERFAGWVQDPVLTEMYKHRPLFDLRPVAGRASLWTAAADAVSGMLDRNFLHVLANDCLANSPPLTFFKDAVVEGSGEYTDVFRLEESVLRPLVDTGRVLGLAARAALGRSTTERLAAARHLFPEHESTFREAADTLRMLLLQQARVGIAQGTDGSELPPTLLGRQDRQQLKGAFRAVLRLLEFTADRTWIDRL